MPEVRIVEDEGILRVPAQALRHRHFVCGFDLQEGVIAFRIFESLTLLQCLRDFQGKGALRHQVHDAGLFLGIRRRVPVPCDVTFQFRAPGDEQRHQRCGRQQPHFAQTTIHNTSLMNS